jgi:hypothetical protein
VRLTPFRIDSRRVSLAGLGAIPEWESSAETGAMITGRVIGGEHLLAVQLADRLHLLKHSKPGQRVRIGMGIHGAPPFCDEDNLVVLMFSVNNFHILTK